MVIRGRLIHDSAGDAPILVKSIHRTALVCLYVVLGPLAMHQLALVEGTRRGLRGLKIPSIDIPFYHPSSPPPPG